MDIIGFTVKYNDGWHKDSHSYYGFFETEEEAAEAVKNPIDLETDSMSLLKKQDLL